MAAGICLGPVPVSRAGCACDDRDSEQDHIDDQDGVLVLPAPAAEQQSR